MSADRELLELAARAAGLDVEFMPISGANIVSGPRAGLWRPLDDDGDALRLAVKLRLGIDYTDCACCVTVYGATDAYGDDIKERIAFLGESVSDPGQATRRAIVRTAAEIGGTL